MSSFTARLSSSDQPTNVQRSDGNFSVIAAGA
jgi:hypothetical protein